MPICRDGEISIGISGVLTATPRFEQACNIRFRRFGPLVGAQCVLDLVMDDSEILDTECALARPRTHGNLRQSVKL